MLRLRARATRDLGDVESAGDAAARALAAFHPAATTDPALTRLAYAGALARAGEIEEACRPAAVAIRCREVPALAVVIRAREFDALLEPKHPAVREWREALAGVRTPG